MLDNRELYEQAYRVTCGLDKSIPELDGFCEHRFWQLSPENQDKIHDIVEKLVKVRSEGKLTSRAVAFATARRTLINRYKAQVTKKRGNGIKDLSLDQENEDGDRLADTIPIEIDFLKDIARYELHIECKRKLRNMPPRVQGALRRKLKGWHRVQDVDGNGHKRLLTASEKRRDYMLLQRYAEKAGLRDLLELLE